MDMQEVATLLHIAEKTIQWPKLKGIHDSAMQALEAHAKEQQEAAEKRAEETKQEAVVKPLDDEAEEPTEEVKRREA